MTTKPPLTPAQLDKFIRTQAWKVAGEIAELHPIDRHGTAERIAVAATAALESGCFNYLRKVA